MGIRTTLKAMVSSDSSALNGLLLLYNHFPFNNHIKLNGGSIESKGVMFKNTTVSFGGKNNKLIVKKGSRLINCKIRYMKRGY